MEFADVGYGQVGSRASERDSYMRFWSSREVWAGGSG